MTSLRALIRKDLLLELRGREVVPGMLTFVIASFALFRFALGGDQLGGGTRAATGMLWVAVVFTAMLGLGRAFAQEREHRIWDGLLAAPLDRGLIWLAKTCSTLVTLVVIQAAALPLFWLFFLQEGAGPSIPVLAAALLLADVGIASLGALLAGLASVSHAREVRAAGAVPALRDPARAGRRRGVGRHDSPANKRFRHDRTARISGSLCYDLCALGVGTVRVRRGGLIA